MKTIKLTQKQFRRVYYTKAFGNYIFNPSDLNNAKNLDIRLTDGKYFLDLTIKLYESLKLRIEK